MRSRRGRRGAHGRSKGRATLKTARSGSHPALGHVPVGGLRLLDQPPLLLTSAAQVVGRHGFRKEHGLCATQAGSGTARAWSSGHAVSLRQPGLVDETRGREYFVGSGTSNPQTR